MVYRIVLPTRFSARYSLWSYRPAVQLSAQYAREPSVDVIPLPFATTGELLLGAVHPVGTTATRPKPARSTVPGHSTFIMLAPTCSADSAHNAASSRVAMLRTCGTPGSS